MTNLRIDVEEFRIDARIHAIFFLNSSLLLYGFTLRRSRRRIIKYFTIPQSMGVCAGVTSIFPI